MKALFYILIGTGFLLPQVYPNEPGTPQAHTIDVDQNGTADFIVEYSSISTSDIPPSHQTIWAFFRPLDGNGMLLHAAKGCFFLQPGDTLYRTQANTNWVKRGVELMHISGSKNVWESEWTITSEQGSPCFIGVKLAGTPAQIGWLKLALNKDSGEISFDEYEIQTTDTLLIE
jgi:hypothetical protein